MLRWQVIKGFVKYKGKVYYQGQLLPASFTDRDREHQVYSRRLIKVEIPDESSTLSKPAETIEKAPIDTAKVAEIPEKVEIPPEKVDLLSEKGATPADTEKKIDIPPTGTKPTVHVTQIKNPSVSKPAGKSS
jgi:hypothetical protein